MKKIQHVLSVLFLAAFMASCNQEMDIDKGQGYLTLQVNSIVSTHTPDATRAAAPEDYDAKKLHVEIRDAAGVVVMSTDDYASDEAFQGNILLNAGIYTVVAHSAHWDGSASGFDTPYYYGSTTIDINAGTLVKATVTCTQANVKITVNYGPTFVQLFKSAVTTITSSLTDIVPLQFVMNETVISGYIPVGDFDMQLAVENKKGGSFSMERRFTEVQARDHYILNIKLADEGYLGDPANGGVKVEVDETTNTYTYTLLLPEKSSVSLATANANAWSTFAYLEGSLVSKSSVFQSERLTFRWRKQGDEVWNEMANGELAIDASDNVTATLRGLTPNTAYEYCLCYVEEDNVITGNIVSFTTELQIPLYNGGFEYWWADGNVDYPTEEGTSYWDTSNPGGASFGGSNTTETKEVVHGGSKAAKLESKYIVIKFAAASMYTGSFGNLVGTSGAKLNWGVPFTARPTALKGWMQYAPVKIAESGNQGYSSSAPAEAPGRGEPDVCGMYCALLSESLVVDNTNMSTFPDWETDSRVIAYGALPTEESVSTNGQWKEVNIPLVYRDLTRKPTHLLVVFSSSKYGDYFHGGKGSILYVDDFSFEYGDYPTVK